MNHTFGLIYDNNINEVKFSSDEGPSYSLNTGVVRGHDRCYPGRCEHVCSDRGGLGPVECSCHPGYDLGPDGVSCIGMFFPLPLCLPRFPYRLK